MKKFIRLIKSILAYLLIGILTLNIFLILKTNMPNPFAISLSQAWQMVKTNLVTPKFYLNLLIWPYVIGKFLVELIWGKTV